MDDLIDAPGGDPEISTQFILADIHWFQEFFVQDFSRMYWLYFFHFLTSMVINNFHIVRITAFPFETDSPLLVYPNAVLTFSGSG